MAAQKYDLLTPEERLSIIRPRIQGLERDHFAISLDIETGNEGAKPRLDAIAGQLDTLRGMASDLEAQVNKKS